MILLEGNLLPVFQVLLSFRGHFASDIKPVSTTNLFSRSNKISCYSMFMIQNVIDSKDIWNTPVGKQALLYFFIVSGKYLKALQFKVFPGM